MINFDEVVSGMLGKKEKMDAPEAGKEKVMAMLEKARELASEMDVDFAECCKECMGEEYESEDKEEMAEESEEEKPMDDMGLGKKARMKAAIIALKKV